MDLEFDDMETNTNLAKEYIRKNREFHSFGPYLSNDVETSTQYFKFRLLEIKYETDLERAIRNIKTANTGLSQTMWIFKFNELASKIEENINLFIQLEYLLRNRPVEDSRLEIELLTKQLRCSSNNNGNGYNILGMLTGAPLLALGCVASMRETFQNIILATADTAVISYLFTKLCHEVGLGDFTLIISTDDHIAEKRDIPNYTILDYCKFTVGNAWSLGVITEHSDVDSAVDVFISSSVHSPWKLRKILVQESVYQQFKDTLSWKCNLKGAHTDDEVSSSYRELCPDVFKFDDRVFLLDYIRSTPPPQLLPEVTVEAYRTNKELISMIRKYEPFYLSLWANDVAESNEVAHAVECRVVWVNSFAEFRGPARISNAIYDVTRTRSVKKTKRISELNKLKEAWLKLEIAERRRILSQVIIKSKEPIGDSIECSTDKLNELNNDKSSGFVEVGKDYICMGIARPAGIVEITSLKDSLFNGRVLESILLGNAIVTDEQDALVKLFEEAGVPAIYAKLEDGDDCIIHSGIDNFTKVIWANVGTIFAN